MPFATNRSCGNFFKSLLKQLGEFITEVRSLADIISIDSQTTCDVILAGLEPHIQSFLLTKQVRTLEELIQQSRLAEDLLSTSDSSNADLMAAMKEIQTRLDQIDVVRSVSPVIHNTRRSKQVSFSPDIPRSQSGIDPRAAVTINLYPRIGTAEDKMTIVKKVVNNTTILNDNHAMTSSLSECLIVKPSLRPSSRRHIVSSISRPRVLNSTGDFLHCCSPTKRLWIDSTTSATIHLSANNHRRNRKSPC